MSNLPISIIIPVYNQAKLIGQCLQSIFRQTFIDFEVIIVDDGSKDDLTTALAPYKNKIKLICQENKGAPAARNRGFQESVGKYVLFCDADCELKPTMLKQMFNILEVYPGVAYVYSSFKFGWKKFKLGMFTEEKLKQQPYIHSTSLLRREFFPQSGWDEGLKKFQDWDLWLTILENGGQGFWLNQVLFKVRTGGTMSVWRPKFLYRLPFFKDKQIEKYRQAEKIIKDKHHLK